MKRSLTDQVGKIKTPTLVMTGEEDYRTPIFRSRAVLLRLKNFSTSKPCSSAFRKSRTASAADPATTSPKLLYVAGWFDQHKSKP